MADGVLTLTADFTAAAGTQTTVRVERGLSATGPWSILHEGPLLDQMTVFTDGGVPMDTPVWYRFTADVGLGTQQIITQGPFTEASTGTVLLRDPLRPWANLEFTFCDSPQLALSAACGANGPEYIWVGLGTKVRRADVTLSDVYGATTPDDTYGRRKRLDTEFQILTKTLAAGLAVEALFAAGGPLLLSMPDEYGWPEAYVQPMDLSEDYISRDQRRPFRLWSANLTVVQAPEGPVQGTVCANWCAVAEEFATFADLTASGNTWADVADGSAVCP